MFLEESQENKIFKYLSIGLLALALLIVAKETLLKSKPLPTFQPLNPANEIKIDFGFLKSPALAELLNFPQIPPSEAFGRENPFIDY